jgi:hypothetical protein
MVINGEYVNIWSKVVKPYFKISYYPSIRLERLKEATETPSQNSRYRWSRSEARSSRIKVQNLAAVQVCSDTYLGTVCVLTWRITSLHNARRMRCSLSSVIYFWVNRIQDKPQAAAVQFTEESSYCICEETVFNKYLKLENPNITNA